MENQKKTICWNCENTNGKKCSWFAKNAKPVDGWEAISNDIAISDHGTIRFCESYIVTKCPNFCPSECYKRELEEIKEREQAKEERQAAKERKKTERQNRIKKPPVRLNKETRIAMGNAMRDCRIKRGLSQKDLSAALGISRSSICRYESGTSQYNPSTLYPALPDIDQFIKEELQDIVLGK